MVRLVDRLCGGTEVQRELESVQRGVREACLVRPEWGDAEGAADGGRERGQLIGRLGRCWDVGLGDQDGPGSPLPRLHLTTERFPEAVEGLGARALEGSQPPDGSVPVEVGSHRGQQLFLASVVVGDQPLGAASLGSDAVYAPFLEPVPE